MHAGIMSDLEYAIEIASKVIPKPEMAGSRQLRRSITKAILRARAQEAEELGTAEGGWTGHRNHRRASSLQEIADQV